MSGDYHYELIYDQTGTTKPPGGQHAGGPATSIRVTHLPSGLMAQCSARSQHKARRIATEMVEWGLLQLEAKQ